MFVICNRSEANVRKIADTTEFLVLDFPNYRRPTEKICSTTVMVRNSISTLRASR